jgi:hypothetical protein
MQARKEQGRAPAWIADVAMSAAALAAGGVLIAYLFRFLPISSLTDTCSGSPCLAASCSPPAC